MLFAMPIIQLLVLPLAANYEVKNINLAVVDHDQSTYSQKLTHKITASGYFKLVGVGSSYNEARAQIEKDQADIILEIPNRFERDLVRENEQKLFVAVNAINGTKANVGGAYLNRIIADFNENVRLDWINIERFSPQAVIAITSSNWFNVHMNYDFFMVPGILALLVTMIGGYMAALNIVKEKEIGTIEQINVTPIRKIDFILGKLIPFWILGIIIFTFGLLVIARFIYHIVPLGSLWVLYPFLGLYMMAILGFGLLVSTYCETQQQAMSVAFFFVMIFLLMSGLFTPIESMPEWAKVIAYFNPVTYFIEVMRMVVLKGSGFYELRFHYLKILGFVLVLNTWAVLNYRKRS